MNIKKIVFNWIYTTENGEEYCSYKVDKQGVIDIEEHTPMGEGDKFYYDVTFQDGHKERIFNINSVIYQ